MNKYLLFLFVVFLIFYTYMIMDVDAGFNAEPCDKNKLLQYKNYNNHNNHKNHKNYDTYNSYNPYPEINKKSYYDQQYEILQKHI